MLARRRFLLPEISEQEREDKEERSHNYEEEVFVEEILHLCDELSHCDGVGFEERGRRNEGRGWSV